MLLNNTGGWAQKYQHTQDTYTTSYYRVFWSKEKIQGRAVDSVTRTGHAQSGAGVGTAAGEVGGCSRECARAAGEVTVMSVMALYLCRHAGQRLRGWAASSVAWGGRGGRKQRGAQPSHTHARITIGRPIPPYYYEHYYKNACSECVPVIHIVIPI